MTTLERSIHLENDLRSVPVGRHFVRGTLLAWSLAELVEDAELGVSELVANAVRHARTDLDLSIKVEDSVVIAIRDGVPELRRPVIANADALADHGRGLHIVAAISSDWGITAAEDGKVIWFALRRPENAGDSADIYEMSSRRSPEPAASEASEAMSSMSGDGARAEGRIGLAH